MSNLNGLAIGYGGYGDKGGGSEMGSKQKYTVANKTKTIGLYIGIGDLRVKRYIGMPRCTKAGP